MGINNVKGIFIFLLVCNLLLASVSVIGAPKYYTFTGEVYSLWNNSENIEFSVNESDEVTYTVLIDFDRAGSTTLNSGYIEYQDDTEATDFFYLDNLGESNFRITDGGLYRGEDDPREQNFGSRNKPETYIYTIAGEQAVIRGGGNSKSFTMSVKSPDVHIPWGVGTEWTVDEMGVDSSGNEARVVSYVTLVSISNTYLDASANFNMQYDDWLFVHWLPASDEPYMLLIVGEGDDGSTRSYSVEHLGATWGDRFYIFEHGSNICRGFGTEDISYDLSVRIVGLYSDVIERVDSVGSISCANGYYEPHI